MKQLCCIVFAIFSLTTVCAQKIEIQQEKIYTIDEADVAPDFRGGIDAFYNLFEKKFVPPQVSGLVDKVVLSFIVEKDDTLTDIKIIHDAGFGTARQAAQIIETLPPWRPGQKSGKAARVLYTLPIAIITE